jgi:hypothetical protein
MRLLITGSRDYQDAPRLRSVLDGLLAEHGELLVVHGAARGADTIAATWVREQKAAGRPVDHEPHPVTGLEWGRYGKRAGHLRNARMVAAGADLLVAFYQESALNKGTKDCCDQAHAAGIEVRPYPQDAWKPPETERRRLIRTMTQDSIDMGLYDLTMPEETR